MVIFRFYFITNNVLEAKLLAFGGVFLVSKLNIFLTDTEIKIHEVLNV